MLCLLLDEDHRTVMCEFPAHREVRFHLNDRFLLCEHNTMSVSFQWVCVCMFVGDREWFGECVDRVELFSRFRPSKEKKNIMLKFCSCKKKIPRPLHSSWYLLNFLAQAAWSHDELLLHTGGADMSARWRLLELWVQLVGWMSWWLMQEMLHNYSHSVLLNDPHRAGKFSGQTVTKTETGFMLVCVHCVL